MGKVLSHMTMSLDGFIATPEDGVEELFEWYGAGDVKIDTPNKDVTFHVDETSAEMLNELMGDGGVLISGRRLFDIAKGWGDRHPSAGTVVVVTHHPPADAKQKWPRTKFVGDVEEAVRLGKQIAGDNHVTIASANVIQQALELGLIDEVCVSVAPVLLGDGIPYFAKLGRGHVMMEDPVVMQGKRALHLRYGVRR